jgi:Ni/Fe-hydrogenase subunit HybB-like protein
MLQTEQRPKKFTITPWMIWLAFMGIILLSGLVAGILVLWKGLGITNLTDNVPWGLWITIDLSSIALGAGAFTMCAGVYLFGLKRYQPIARTATFIGLICYTMATLSLILDIGRPDRFWHSLIYWNPHSLLWEVTMCVVLYLTVLVFESMPIIANWEWLRKHMPKVTKMMSGVHHYAPILAIIGLGLSSLHQSSLGATYGVIIARPFWYKPEMSVLFMLTAIVGGISVTLFVTMLASRLTKKAKINDSLVERVAQFVAYLLIGAFYFRFWDALAQTYTYDPGRTEGLLYLTKGPFAFNFWVLEMFFGLLVPMVLLLYRPTRTNRFWRMAALLMVAIGVVTYRWDTNITGQLVLMPYIPGLLITYTSYKPSMIEILSGAAIIAYGLTALSLGVKYFRVVDHTLIEEEHEKVHVESTEPVRI